MAFTFKAKKRPNPLQVGLAHFAKGFAAGGVKAMQDQLVLRKENTKVFSKLRNTVSHMTATARSKGDDDLLKQLMLIGINLDTNAYTNVNDAVLAINESGVFLIEAYSPYAKDIGITLPGKETPIRQHTVWEDGVKVVYDIYLNPDGTERRIKVKSFGQEPVDNRTEFVNIATVGDEKITTFKRGENGDLIKHITEEIVPKAASTKFFAVLDKYDSNRKKYVLESEFFNNQTQYTKIEATQIAAHQSFLIRERARLLALQKGGTTFTVTVDGQEVKYETGSGGWNEDLHKEQLEGIEKELIDDYGHTWLSKKLTEAEKFKKMMSKYTKENPLEIVNEAGKRLRLVDGAWLEVEE